MVRANSTCLSVRLPVGFSASSFDRISRLFSGVRSSWLMLARNSDLYFEVSASCSAFSSSAQLGLFDFAVLGFHLLVLRARAAAPSPPARRWSAAALPAGRSSSSDCAACRLLLQPVVGLLQLFLLALQLGGQQLRLLEQAFGAHVGGDRVEHDADGFHQLVEEGLVGLAERAEGGQLDDRLDLAFEQHRQHDRC